MLHFELCHAGPYGARNSKRYSSDGFHPHSSKLYEDIAYQGVVRANSVFGNRPSLEHFVALETLTKGVNGQKY